MTTPDRQPIALLVNDDPGQLHLASTILSRDGIEVISCSGTEQALDVLAEGAAVAVIVTDLYMPRIEEDPLALERIVGNLLQNAFKFTPDGGQITVRAEPHAEEAW